jgi:hypothetical protein
MNLGMLHSLHLVVRHDCVEGKGAGSRSDFGVGEKKGRDRVVDVDVGDRMRWALPGNFSRGACRILTAS